jgi:hypothetical protein
MHQVRQEARKRALENRQQSHRACPGTDKKVVEVDDVHYMSV